MLKFFSKSVDDSVKELNVDITTGLTSSEVKKRQSQYGENVLEGGVEKSVLSMIFEQLKDFLVLILMVAAIISIALGETIEGVVILSIVVLNTFLGVYQENKASNALKALKEMASPLAKVLRDGKIFEVASKEVVVGDIVILEAGDYIPADLRIIESVNLKIDEAALTGESVPVEKDSDSVLAEDAGLGDRVNSAFMGTVITYGRGRGLITDIGMKTQMGNIAGMLTSVEDEATPLQKKLDVLGKNLGLVCIIICIVIFGLGYLQTGDIFESFMGAVALAVAAIPEGLTVVVTVVLALGMQRMVKVHTIVKRLSAVETLGSTTVICSDKTGTLTQNKMTIQKIYNGLDVYDVTGTGYSSTGSIVDKDGNDKTEETRAILEAIVLCNDASYDPTDDSILGDPTEIAMVVAAYKAGIEKAGINETHPRVQELPFDSTRKLMSTVHDHDGQMTMFTKGAPDELLRRCDSILIDGKVEALTDSKRQEILDINETFAKEALRVIGSAFKVVGNEKIDFDAENHLVFTGLVGMIDPPREEAKEAIEVCKTAGIQVKMITGDHKITATAIAGQLGIVGPNARAVEGSEINEMDEMELREVVKTVSVFARVSPEHKVRLVDAIRANGNIVAMTGDGVNDAPSLKHADIGVAMGITGTDVSKEAADMILTDDNFASIVKAVAEGRTIYANIRKVVGFLLSCNIGEILVIFLAMLAGLEAPLVAIQLLAINLITDAFPAFALGMEKEENNVMLEQPRDPQEPIVDRSMAISIGIQSVFLALGVLASYLYAYHFHNGVEDARTAAFLTIVLGELLRAYSARSEHISVFKMKVFENSYLNKAVLASMLFVLATIYLPGLNTIFSTVPLQWDEFIFAIVFAFIPLFGGEVAKKFTHR